MEKKHILKQRQDGQCVSESLGLDTLYQGLASEDSGPAYNMMSLHQSYSLPNSIHVIVRVCALDMYRERTNWLTNLAQVREATNSKHMVGYRREGVMLPLSA